MIDILAPEALFSDEAALLDRATHVLLEAEHTTKIALAVANTGAFLATRPAHRVTAGGKPDRVVRIQILTPLAALTQDQRAQVTKGLTDLVAELAGTDVRTWVLFHEATDGGWGIGGIAYTNAALADAVRASLR